MIDRTTVFTMRIEFPWSKVKLTMAINNIYLKRHAQIDLIPFNPFANSGG
jgi:hypothetical protein